MALTIAQALKLTRTQVDAHRDLERVGYLFPKRRGRLGTFPPRHEYSRQTLQALVDAGHARWDGSLVRPVAQKEG